MLRITLCTTQAPPQRRRSAAGAASLCSVPLCATYRCPTTADLLLLLLLPVLLHLYARCHYVQLKRHPTAAGLLLVLLVLHIYWTYLILRILVRQLKGKEAKDIREADENSDDD